MKLSIIIINHNTKKLTAQAISSIAECAPILDYEIVVVDNSTDSAQRYDEKTDKVRVFGPIPNKGFGNACNYGANKAEGAYLLFLNSDTLMHKGTLEQCVAQLASDPKIGVLGGRTVLQDGSFDHSCKRGFPTPAASFYYFTGLDKRFPQSSRFGAYRQSFLGEYSVGEVDAVSGSFMFVPAWVFKEAGGFDEAFFMYGEDLDLCYRIKERGYKVLYYGKASITHLKGQSGLHKKSETVIKHFYNAMRIFYKKHYQKKYGPFVSAAVYLGIELKYRITRARAG